MSWHARWFLVDFFSLSFLFNRFMLSPSCQQRLNLAALVLNGHFYDKIVREAVSFDADEAIVDEADVVVGERDLVQVEAD